jgi:glycosyltransferase involved in cell wall biosynthesis
MLTSSYPKYRGETTAPFIEEIAAGLARRGHAIHVVAPFHPELRREPIERGVNLHFYRYAPTRALNVYGYAQSLRADIGLRGAAVLATPLAVLAGLRSLFQLTEPVPRFRLPLFGDLGRPRGSALGFDLIHAHWVLPNGVPAALVAWQRRLPLVVSLHGSDVFMAEKAPPLALAARSVFRRSVQVTACSRDLADRAIRLGADSRNTSVIPYGVDLSFFRPEPTAGAAVRRELGLSAENQLIVTVSRLVYKKGLTYLLDAFPSVLRQHPNARLVIGGAGDLRNELEQQARRLGIAPQVLFPGQLERERAARYIAGADVYVVPSIRDQRGNVDGLPNALLEGMGAGRPVVASRVAGIPDVIDDHVHGLLVPEQNALALADAIHELLANPALATELGSNARARIYRELTWNATVAGFERVYAQALA